MRLVLSSVLCGLSLALGHPLDSTQNALPDRFIVSLKPGLSETTVEGHLNWVRDVHRRRSVTRRDIAGVEKTFNIGTFHAYAGSFDQETLTEIKSNEAVC